MGLSVLVNGTDYRTNSKEPLAEKNTIRNLTSHVINSNSFIEGTHSDGTPYNLLYSSASPSYNDIDTYLYEEDQGTFFYKYGYSWKGDYQCTTDITFNNTQLHRGTQDVVMYAFIGATDSGQNAVDFGFIADPTKYNRNSGLYGFHFVRYLPEAELEKNRIWDIDLYPKVNLRDPDNPQENTMLIEDKTITMRLTIDQYGGIGTDMFLNGQLIYYDVEQWPGLTSGATETLSFFQAVSCVGRDGAYTYPNNGAYFRNIKYSNTKLNSYTDGLRNFGTYGNDTYFVYQCKPDNLSYSYGTNTETVSIEYNN